MSGGSKKTLGSPLGRLFGLTGGEVDLQERARLMVNVANDPQREARMLRDLANARPGGIIRVANAAQISSVPVRLSQRSEVVNCDGCGAPLARHRRECEYCRRPQ